MKKEMKQVLWVVALFVILMTATGNLVSAAGFDWSDDTFGNACKKVYSVSFRSGGGASSAIYKKLEKKQKYGSMITIPKVPQVPAGYQAEGWSLKKGGAEAGYKPGKKYFVKRNVTFYAVIKKGSIGCPFLCFLLLLIMPFIISFQLHNPFFLL